MTYVTQSFWLRLSRGSVPPRLNFRVDVKATRDDKGWDVAYRCQNSGEESGRRDVDAVVRLPATWTADLDDLANKTGISPRDPNLLGAIKPSIGFDGDKPESWPDHEPDWHELEDAVRALAGKSQEQTTRFVLREGTTEVAVTVRHDLARRQAVLSLERPGAAPLVRHLDLQTYKQLRAGVLNTAQSTADDIAQRAADGRVTPALLDVGDGHLVPSNCMSLGVVESEDLVAIIRHLDIPELRQWAAVAKKR